MATPTSTTQRRPDCSDESAKQAEPAAMPPGLRHADDTKPGYTRKREKDGFVYFDTTGKRVDDEDDIKRINALAIPPAYEEVWICADPRGHIQATGRDARGRKQYRYHPRWRETRDATKYERMAEFGRALPRIRARVARDLKLPGMPCDKVIAAIVQLLDTTLIRIGSVEYARDNQSYGLTTLRKKHVKIEAGRLRFRFRGKSGIEHDVTVENPRIKRIVRRCAELPGHDLFQYLDDDGTRHTVGSADINDYLRRASDADFTAKDYRTWAGSVYALAALRRLICSDAAQARHHIVATVKDVAALLRNTPAVCRRCYIHPAVISAFEADQLQGMSPGQSRRGLRVDEVAFAALLAQAEKRAAKLARQAGAKGRKARESAEADSIDGSITSLLKKSREARKKAAQKEETKAGRAKTARRTAAESREMSRAAH
ncbi:DNA topoisomerase-1 [Paraburkholderia fungorum]|uniref:DNA topoisomerase n=1 Tax=Paraburkholderia fungorum TaxID=134537 RepID=A0A1H1I381_9BURK|nr:DNA topoisomerase [Paraburkholderia fungorum]SDR32120.1 DNA topoisomerase-1 [Paraburkholderia fungorum]